MIRGTTPDYILTIPGYDLTSASVYVTIAQGPRKLTLTGDEITVTASGSDTEITFRLSQANTLYLSEGKAEIQVKWIDSEDTVMATEIASIDVRRALLKREIAYE